MNVQGILLRLEKSKFRNSFHLKGKELEIARQKSPAIIKKHAEDILQKRIKTLQKNEGRQTPWKGHPVFIAQHATATCCRSCIEKWHGIPKTKPLSDNEFNFIIDLIISWISKEIENASPQAL